MIFNHRIFVVICANLSKLQFRQKPFFKLFKQALQYHNNIITFFFFFYSPGLTVCCEQLNLCIGNNEHT